MCYGNFCDLLFCFMFKFHSPYLLLILQQIFLLLLFYDIFEPKRHPYSLFRYLSLVGLNRKNKIKSLRILFAYLIFVRIYNFDVTCTDLVQEMGCKATNLNVECVREPVRCFFFFSNSILWRFFNNVSRSVWSMWESSSLYLTKWLLDIKKSILKLVYSQTVEKSNDFALNLPVLFDFDYIVWSWKLNASVSNQNR